MNTQAETQACSACKAIHYLHPNAKQGGFGGPTHAKVGSTCVRCGEMWPCDVTELREGYARLQARVDEAEDAAGMFQLQMRAAMQIKGERDRYKALAEEAEQHIDRLEATVVAAVEDLEKAEALAERRKEALPDAGKLRTLADWFDVYDDNKGRSGAEVQQDLRRWAAAIEEEDR